MIKKLIFCFSLFCSIVYGQKMPLKQSPAPPEYPSTLSGLQFWYSPRKSVTVSGSNVTALGDNSGNGNDMSTFTGGDGNTTTYVASSLNGKPAVQFANSGGYGYGQGPRITALEGLTQWTLAMVCTKGALMYSKQTVMNFTLLHYSDSHFYGSFNSGTNYGDAGAQTGPKVFILVYDGSLTGDSNRLKFYVNGSLQSPSYVGGIPSSSTVTADAANRIYLNDYNNTALAFTTLFYEGLGLNRAITGTEITNLNSFLQTLYAL